MDLPKTELELGRMAGRELDELVAQFVLGFKWPEDSCPVCGFHFSVGQGCSPGNCSMRPVPAPHARDACIAYYSSDVRAAFTLLSVDDRWRWRIIKTQFRWRVRLDHDNMRFDAETDSDSVESLCRAICVLAVLAVARHDSLE